MQERSGDSGNSATAYPTAKRWPHGGPWRVAPSYTPREACPENPSWTNPRLRDLGIDDEHLDIDALPIAFVEKYVFVPKGHNTNEPTGHRYLCGQVRFPNGL